MISAMAGSILRTSRKIDRSPPPKRQRAIEYAVGKLTTSAEIMLSVESTTLFMKYRAPLDRVNSARYCLSDGSAGIQTGGNAKKASLPLSDVVTIAKTGRRNKTSDAKTPGYV